MLLLFITVAIALCFSFLCSLSEACLLSLSLTDIARISDHNPMLGRLWHRFKENVQKPISVILIINTLANAMGAAISGAMFSDVFGARWLWLYSLVFSLIIIQWGEIMPKSLGVKFNKTISYVIAVPLNILIQIFTPVLYLITLINRPFLGKKNRSSTNDALNEISILARFASLNRLISKEQEKMVHRSMTLSNTTVYDVMVKREEIKSISVSMSLSEALIEAHLHHHTRYPLVEAGNLDNVLGYVNFKDIVTALRINPDDPSLKGIARPILNIRQSEILSATLARFTQGHHHVAIVKDDSGKTCGLLTLEDIIESVVGEIEDEFDILPGHIYRITHERFLVGGASNMAQLRQKIDESVPENQKTVDEWMREMLGKPPRVEDKIELEGVILQVKKVRRSKIFEIMAIKRALRGA